MNGSQAGPIITEQPITVTVALPGDLNNVVPNGGTAWQFTTNGTTVIASYSGSYPVSPGTNLVPITITATMGTPSSMSPVSTATVATSQESNTNNNTASDTLTICQPDLTLNKLHQGTGVFQVGQSISYTLTVSDGPEAGPVLAGQPITVTDTVPSSISQVTPTGSAWQFTTSSSPAGTTVTATYAGNYPIIPGDSLPDITIRGTLTSAAVPAVVNNATVNTPLDSNIGNNTGSDTLDVSPAPDLTLSLTHAGTACITTGEQVIYTALVTNSSLASSVFTGQPITVTVTLPEGLSNVVPNGGTDWQITSNGTMLIASYSGSYPINAGTTLSPITISAILTAPVSMNPLSQATVETPQESNTDNNTASDTLTICPAALVISKTHRGVGPFQVGQRVTYTIKVSDNPTAGPIIAGQPIVVIDPISRGLKQIEATGTGWRFTRSSSLTTTRVIATYSGSYPVVRGEHLPDITISGVLTNVAFPTLINGAIVGTVSGGKIITSTSVNRLPVHRVPPPRLPPTGSDPRLRLS